MMKINSCCLLNSKDTFPIRNASIVSFIATEKQSNVYFGKVDIPQHWARDFTTRMKAIRETYPEVKLQYSMEPSVLAKWNLSLKETYGMSKQLRPLVSKVCCAIL